MQNWANRFPANTVVGTLLRWPLKLLPVARSLPILSGPLRGLYWLPRAGVRSMWLGFYERPLAKALCNSLRDGAVFFDVGANVGYFTLLGCRAVGVKGRVVAIEPSPPDALLLNHHVVINGYRDFVQVVQAAATDTIGTSRFANDAPFSQGSLDSQGRLVVRTVTLDSLVEVAGAPHVIKIDVEGHAAGVLRGAIRILEQHRPVIFAAVHAVNQEEERVAEVLRACDYQLSRLPGDDPVLVATPRAEANRHTPG